MAGENNKNSGTYLNKERIELVEKLVGAVADKLVESNLIDRETALILARQNYRPQIQYLVDKELESVDAVNQILGDSVKTEIFASIAQIFAGNLGVDELAKLKRPKYFNQDKDFNKDSKPVDLGAIAKKVENDPTYKSNQDLSDAMAGEDSDNQLNAKGENPAEPKTPNADEFLRRFQTRESKSVVTQRDLDDLKNTADKASFDHSYNPTPESAQNEQAAAKQYAEKLGENQQAVQDEKLQAEKFKRQKPSRAESGPGGFYEKGQREPLVSDQDLRDRGHKPNPDGTFDPSIRQAERDRRAEQKQSELESAKARGENYADSPPGTKKGVGSVKSFGLYDRKGLPVKIAGIPILPGIDGSSNRDIAASAMKATNIGVGLISKPLGDAVKSAGGGVEQIGGKLKSAGEDLANTEGDGLKAKASRFLGKDAVKTGERLGKAGETIKGVGDQIKKVAARAAARAVGAAIPMISTILIFVLGFGIMTAIIIIILCKALDTPGLGFVASWIVPEELKGICKGLGFKGSCDTGSGGGSVSGSTPVTGAKDVACLSIIGGNVSDEIRAFMRAISYIEGASDPAGYYRLVGGKMYNNVSVHPGIENTSLYRETGFNSDAFGRFQMLSTTWNSWAKVAGVPTIKPGTNSNGEVYYNMSPQYQDLAVAKFLQSSGLEEKLKAGDIQGAANTDAACQWASVPGNRGGCSQPNSRTPSFISTYQVLLKEEKNPAGCGSKQDAPVITNPTATTGPQTQQTALDRMFGGVGVEAQPASNNYLDYIINGYDGLAFRDSKGENFGPRNEQNRWDDNSGGVDITLSFGGGDGLGFPLVAHQEAIVRKITLNNGAAGNGIEVYYPSYGFRAEYYHLQSVAPNLKVGDKILPGGLIGKQGSSGTFGDNAGFVHTSMQLYEGDSNAGRGKLIEDPPTSPAKGLQVYRDFVTSWLQYIKSNETKIKQNNYTPTAPGSGSSSGSTDPECNDPCLAPGASQNAGSGKAASGLVKDAEGVEQKALFPDDSAVPNIATKLLVIGTSAKESGTDGNQGKLFLADLNRSQIGWFQQADSELNVFQAAGTDPKNGFMGNDQAQLKTFLKRIELEGQTANLDKVSKEIVANGNKVTPNHIAQIVSIYEKVQRSGEPGGVLGKVGQYITYALKNNLVGSYKYGFEQTQTLAQNGRSQKNLLGFSLVFGGIEAQAAGATKKYITISKNGQEYGAYIITPGGFDPKTSTIQPVILGHDGFAGTYFEDNKALAEKISGQSGGQVLLMDYERGTGSNPQIFSRDIDQTRAFMDYVDKESGKTNNFTLSGSSRGAGVAALTAAQDARVNKLTIAYPVTNLSEWTGRGESVYNMARGRYGNDLNGADLKKNPPKNPKAEIYLTVGDDDTVLKSGDPNYLKNADEYVQAMKAKGINITYDKIAGADHGYARLVNISETQKAAQEKFVQNAAGKAGAAGGSSGGACSANSTTNGVINAKGKLSLLEAARKGSQGKKPDGKCWYWVAEYIIESGGFGKVTGQVNMPYVEESAGTRSGASSAFNTGMYWNKNAKALGLVNLLDSNPNANPYNAPAGSILVIAYGYYGAGETSPDGDMSVADGKGKFFNGGEMVYPPAGQWNGSYSKLGTGPGTPLVGSGKLVGIYVPTQ